MKRVLLCVIVMMSMLAVVTHAEEPEELDLLKDRPDAPKKPLPPDPQREAASKAPLGPVFESRTAGIALRPPAGCNEIRRPVPDEIVVFMHEKNDWVLRVMQFTLKDAAPLTTTTDPATGREKVGVLEQTAADLMAKTPGAQLMRQDVLQIGDGDVGMIAIRMSVGTSHRLLQMGIIRQNDLVYYVLELTSRGAKPHSPAEVENPDERKAVETFEAVLDSVRLLDRSAIRQDQEMRLYRTRALFVTLNEQKLRSVLVPQSYLRLIKDGKDIGYSYIIEEPKRDGGRPGVSIGIRSRSYPGEGMQVDAESWLYCTFDRRHEEWSNVASVRRAGGEPQFRTELGSSLYRQKAVGVPANPLEGRRGVAVPVEERILDVQFVGKEVNQLPVHRELPAFYIPQAIGHLLPRLLPLKELKTYLFAIYVSDQQEVMMRYVDVEEERQVTLAGTRFRAYAVKDRIGLAGSVTTHYVTADGKYMGSENKDSNIVILPTDAATLNKLWKNADLSRPSAPLQQQLDVPDELEAEETPAE